MWDKVFKNRTSKNCEKQPLKIWSYPCLAYLLQQFVFGPFLNDLSHIINCFPELLSRPQKNITKTSINITNVFKITRKNLVGYFELASELMLSNCSKNKKLFCEFLQNINSKTFVIRFNFNYVYFVFLDLWICVIVFVTRRRRDIVSATKRRRDIKIRLCLSAPKRKSLI